MKSSLINLALSVLGKTSSKTIDKLRQRGAEIGQKVIIFDPLHTFIDSGRPWLIKIGSYVKIASGVKILTHDYSLSVLRRTYGEWLGEGAKTVIGDNVFIGMNSVLLMGTEIGNNVIVGAGSVVRGKVPDNVVIAGNPARVVCSIEEHYQNRKRKTVDECKTVIKEYYKTYGYMPSPRDLGGFKFLFAPRDKDWLEEHGLNFQCNGDEPLDVENAFFTTPPIGSVLRNS